MSGGLRAVEQAAETIRVRRRRRRRLRVLRQLLAVAALAVVFLFLRSDFFLIRHLEISGLAYLTPSEVKALSGLERQMLVWQVRPWRVRDRLSGHPRIAAANVSVALPNRVRIEVVERRPIAVIPLSEGGAFAEVDREGRVLAASGRPRVMNVPVLTGIPLTNPRPGQRLATTTGLLAVRVADALGPAGRARVAEINVGLNGEVRLYTVEGVPVFMGVDEAWSEKGQALAAVLGSVADPRLLAYVDLRSAKRPVIRLRRTAGPGSGGSEAPGTAGGGAASGVETRTGAARTLHRLPPEHGGLP